MNGQDRRQQTIYSRKHSEQEIEIPAGAAFHIEDLPILQTDLFFLLFCPITISPIPEPMSIRNPGSGTAMKFK